MRYPQIRCASFCILLAASAAMAKDKKVGKPMDPQAMMELYRKLAAPGEPHQLLASLAGNWTTKTREWMAPDQPPVDTTGFAEFKVLLEGRFLQQEFTGQMMGQPISYLEMIGYDNLLQRYVTTWMSSTSTMIFPMEGTASADGKTITLKGKHAEPGGGTMKHRGVWKIVDNDTQTFEMYGSHQGGKEWKIMETTYTRKQ